jgi:hypothetical protein
MVVGPDQGSGDHGRIMPRRKEAVGEGRGFHGTPMKKKIEAKRTPVYKMTGVYTGLFFGKLKSISFLVLRTIF